MSKTLFMHALQHSNRNSGFFRPNHVRIRRPSKHVHDDDKEQDIAEYDIDPNEDDAFIRGKKRFEHAELASWGSVQQMTTMEAAFGQSHLRHLGDVNWDRFSDALMYIFSISLH